MGEDTLKIAGSLLLIIVVCAGFGTCRKWEYDECVKVGHSKSYCAASTAGCFDGPNRSRK